MRQLEASGAAGRQNSAARPPHLHQAKVSFQVGYLLNQLEPILGESLNCFVVTCEPGSR